MVKVKYIGSKRESFNWVSMGKAVGYIFNPGETKLIPERDLPYLRSFGTFEAIVREAETESTEVVVVNVPVETPAQPEPVVVPEPKPESVGVLEPAPIVEPIPTPAAVVIPEPVAVPIVEEAEEEDPVDYTSFNKKELIKLCKERKLDTIGKRDDLIARLVNHDNSK